MVIHKRMHHSCATSLNFKMEAVKTFSSPLERQLDEALRIKNSEVDILMNFGSEWKLDSIPRANFSAPGLERRRANRKRTYSVGMDPRQEILLFCDRNLLELIENLSTSVKL